MKITLQFRDQIQALGSFLVDELENICRRTRTAFHVEHKEDNSHADVNATSLTIRKGTDAEIEAGTATGIIDTDADGPHVFGPVTLGTPISGGTGTGASGAGISIEDQTGLGEDWAIIVSNDNLDHSIGFYDKTSGVEVLKLYRTGANTYSLQPSEDGIATVKLGDHTDTDFRFDECAASKFYERNDAGLGYWTAVAHDALNFTASSGTWTVDVADQVLYRYTIIGKTMVIAWSIANSDVSAGSVLRLAIPGGNVAANTINGFHEARNAGGAAALATCRSVSGQAYIELYPTLGTGGTWTITAADNTASAGQITIELQ
jgi:hypothetical protein